MGSLELHPDGILIRNIRKPRSGWDAAFAAMAESDDDVARVEVPSEFDKKEWQW